MDAKEIIYLMVSKNFPNYEIFHNKCLRENIIYYYFPYQKYLISYKREKKTIIIIKNKKH